MAVLAPRIHVSLGLFCRSDWPQRIHRPKEVADALGLPVGLLVCGHSSRESDEKWLRCIRGTPCGGGHCLDSLCALDSSELCPPLEMKTADRRYRWVSLDEAGPTG